MAVVEYQDIPLAAGNGSGAEAARGGSGGAGAEDKHNEHTASVSSGTTRRPRTS